MTTTERFMSKVDMLGDDECWPWDAGKMKSGYGGFHPEHGKIVTAHAFMFALSGHVLPDGLVIDHICERRDCVNPTHLRAITNEENLARGRGYRLLNGQDTACINGHEYTDENTYLPPSGAKRCRECMRINDRKRGHRGR